MQTKHYTVEGVRGAVGVESQMEAERTMLEHGAVGQHFDDGEKRGQAQRYLDRKGAFKIC